LDIVFTTKTLPQFKIGKKPLAEALHQLSYSSPDSGLHMCFLHSRYFFSYYTFFLLLFKTLSEASLPVKTDIGMPDGLYTHCPA
jgi:hypothetical protein